LITDVQKAVGDRICEFRKKKGWTQKRFAEICRLHRSHMGQIERGESNLTLSTLLIITEKLGISVASLFAGIR